MKNSGGERGTHFAKALAKNVEALLLKLSSKISGQYDASNLNRIFPVTTDLHTYFLAHHIIKHTINYHTKIQNTNPIVCNVVLNSTEVYYLSQLLLIGTYLTYLYQIGITYSHNKRRRSLAEV